MTYKEALDELCISCNRSVVCMEECEAKHRLKFCVEKTIAKSPILELRPGVRAFICPLCGTTLFEKRTDVTFGIKYDWCLWCGKKLDWGSEAND